MSESVDESNPHIRVVFLEGGKGGVGKTEVALCLVPWYRHQGIEPVLLDFDVENTNKSGLQNFCSEAEKIDVHREGALDEFFEACDLTGVEVVLADLGAGAGKATFDWFREAFDDAQDLNLDFTAVAVTTNEAGAVQSVLKWADEIQDRARYLVVLNEYREWDCAFEYWHDEAQVVAFRAAFDPVVITMGARIAEFQSELRNQCVTLEDVIERRVDDPFFKKTKNLIRAKRYQRQMFRAFDDASGILLP